MTVSTFALALKPLRRLALVVEWEAQVGASRAQRPS